jgi:transposase
MTPESLAASTRAELELQVVTLTAQRMSRRAIARALGVSRNTVKRLLLNHAEQRELPHSALPKSPKNAPRAKLTDDVATRIAGLLATYPNITAQRVFEILKDEGFAGCYSTVKRHVRGVRPSKKPKPSLTTPVYGPGKMAECDWSPYKVPLLDGSTLSIQAFGYVLVHSRRKYYGVFNSNNLHALMDGHVQAFARFEGCAESCKYDSQKPVVLRWEGSQPIYNPRFLAFAAHYEFRPAAVRYNPNAKPRVERGFWEFETSFLNGRSFRNRDDFIAQLEHWLDTIVDYRKRHRLTPLDRFAEEEQHLVALPRHPYDTARVVYRICSIDGFIDWDGNRYAVPYDHITDILPVRITQHELFVYAADLRCVARHELAARGLGLTLDPTGYHPPPRGISAIDLDQLRLTFEQMGQGGTEFSRLLSATPPRLWGRQARQILLLRERYDTSDLDCALGHAALYGAFEHKAIERILAARAQPRPLDEYVAEDAMSRITASLGQGRAQARDLTEFDRLPICGAVAPSSLCDLQQKESSPCENQDPTLCDSENPTPNPIPRDSENLTPMPLVNPVSSPPSLPSNPQTTGCSSNDSEDISLSSDSIKPSPT